MDKVTTERVYLLKKQAAEQLNAVWDAEERGDHELAEWHWSVFARLMKDARELTEEKRYKYGKGRTRKK